MKLITTWLRLRPALSALAVTFRASTGPTTTGPVHFRNGHNNLVPTAFRLLSSTSSTSTSNRDHDPGLGADAKLTKALKMGQDHTQVTQRQYVPRRAIMYVPGDDERKQAKIPSLGVDCVVLDCEDGVAINRKDDARNRIRSVLDSQSINFGRSECTVRVNSVDSGFCEDDLDVILGAQHLPSTIHLPKVDFVDQLHWFSDTTTQLLRENKTATNAKTKMNLILFIESAQGMLALPEICKTAWQLSVKSHFVPDALVFGSDDYCADIGATRTKDAKELLYARQHFVMVAKAFKLQAIDIVHIDYKDLDGLRQHCLEGAAMGFTGKQLIHPGQINICQESFSPSKEKVKWAHDLIQAFDEHQESGKGAFNFRGSMIDMPLVLQAKNVLHLASLIADE